MFCCSLHGVYAGVQSLSVWMCVLVCIATAEYSGLFLILVFEADKMVIGLLHQCRHGGNAFTSAYLKLH